jgi:hypothetical protein
MCLTTATKSNYPTAKQKTTVKEIYCEIQSI